MKIILINHFDDEMEIDKWHNAMLWCPSQCYCHKVDENGTHYILYLRWRWDDPWQGHIVTNAFNEDSMSSDAAEWSGDIFAERELFFTDKEHVQARSTLEEIFTELYGG